jgi:hypothetical protein
VLVPTEAVGPGRSIRQHPPLHVSGSAHRSLGPPPRHNNLRASASSARTACLRRRAGEGVARQGIGVPAGREGDRVVEQAGRGGGCSAEGAAVDGSRSRENARRKGDI